MTDKVKVEFVCMEDKCMKDGTGGCTLSFYSEGKHCDSPSYCPYELDPNDRKFVPWRQLS